MTQPIKASEVTVTTATVDIAVIRVGAKQMTQSVFKQLPDLGNARDMSVKHNYIEDNSGQRLETIYLDKSKNPITLWGWVKYPTGGRWVVASAYGKLWKFEYPTKQEYSHGWESYNRINDELYDQLTFLNECGVFPQLFIAV